MPENQSIENGNGFKVLRLEASNIKRLRAVDITPDPRSPLVVVGGNNGEGKSSTLDAIMYALGGKDAVCADPIRHGQKKGHVTVDVGKFVVTRKFSPAGQSLQVQTKEGLNVPSPQGTLDGILGTLSFDPLLFSRMAPAKRLATLISLVKMDIDLSDLATKRKALYDSRTTLSQRIRDHKGILNQTPEPDKDLPSEKVDVQALVAEKSRLSGIIADNARARAAVPAMEADVNAAARAVQRTEDEISRLNAALEAAMRTLETDRERHQNAMNALRSKKIEVEGLADPDTSSIDAQISAASDTNTKIDRAAEYRQKAKTLATMEEQHDRISEDIESLDQAKEDALSRAQFPISGMRFEDGDVSFNGVLFDQLSSAEQVKVSLAMAMAMNPQLKVILIRDGSLLDETSLGIVREMAQSRGYQVWLEVVGNRQDATIIIEDGAVVGAEVTEPEAEVAA